MTEIKRISYEACFNLENYENEKIRIEATYPSDRELAEVVDELRQQCIAAAQPAPSKGWRRRRELQDEISRLENRLRELQANWETVSTFLKTQGIKPDIPEFPQLTNLLPAAPDTEVVEPDYDDIDF